jgi:hypothetical protein
MHTRIATTNGATPMTTRTRDTRTALDAYMAHHAAALALPARITEALANHDDAQVEDPDHQSIGLSAGLPTSTLRHRMSRREGLGLLPNQPGHRG